MLVIRGWVEYCVGMIWMVLKFILFSVVSVCSIGVLVIVMLMCLFVRFLGVCIGFLGSEVMMKGFFCIVMLMILKGVFCVIVVVV